MTSADPHARGQAPSRSPDRYDPERVERKWQEEWDRRGTNLFTDEDLRAAE